MADAGQIEQVIMNLAVNARDAMPHGGTLTIWRRPMYFSTRATRWRILKCSRRIRHARRDGHRNGNGGGNQGAHIRTILYHQTHGAGTGLGLATVYGMVKQSGGWIWVYSEPGNGTTFKVYLPCTDASAPRVTISGSGRRARPRDDSHRGGPTGSPYARGLALQRYGYTVLDAANGEDAISRADAFPGAIDLMVTDVIMPGMNGRELADCLTIRRPDLRVLFVSGYTESIIPIAACLTRMWLIFKSPSPRNLWARRCGASWDRATWKRAIPARKTIARLEDSCGRSRDARKDSHGLNASARGFKRAIRAPMPLYAAALAVVLTADVGWCLHHRNQQTNHHKDCKSRCDDHEPNSQFSLSASNRGAVSVS